MPPDQGLESETLRAALREALAGRTATLERLLTNLGAVLTPRPNLKLAAALGAEVAAHAGPVAPLLSQLGAEDAAPDTPRAYLPIAAAHGWAACLRRGRDQVAAWEALAELAADERVPVRLGTLDALVAFCGREGGADELIEQAAGWLENPDRERRFGSAALVLDVLEEPRLLAGLRDRDRFFDYLTRVLDEVAEAPRSAERSESRRRLLASLPRALATAVAGAMAADRGPGWLQAECERAKSSAVRKALSDTFIALRAPKHGLGSTAAEGARAALQGSAKPLRDPSRVRPGVGRGKATRRIK